MSSAISGRHGDYVAPEDRINLPDDLDESFVMWDITTTTAADGQTIAKIHAGGKDFEARDQDPGFATSEVARLVREAQLRGEVVPDYF